MFNKLRHVIFKEETLTKMNFHNFFASNVDSSASGVLLENDYDAVNEETFGADTNDFVTDGDLEEFSKRVCYYFSILLFL